MSCIMTMPVSGSWRQGAEVTPKIEGLPQHVSCSSTPLGGCVGQLGLQAQCVYDQEASVTVMYCHVC